MSIVWTARYVCILATLVTVGCASSTREDRVAERPSGPGASQTESRDGSTPNLATGLVQFDSATSADLEVKRTATGHLLVKPVLNGKQPGWFIFDTGAGICVVSTPHAASFDLQKAGSIGAVGVGGAGEKELYRAQTLTLGPLTLRDHPIMATDLSFLKQYLGEEIHGVLGYGVLSQCVTVLDIQTPRIALHQTGYSLKSGEWQSLELIDRIPAVHCRWEGRGGLFRLDTGANGHVTFHQPAVEKWNLLQGRDVGDAKMGGVGGFVAAKRGTVEWFELGGRRTENVPALFAIEAKGAFADGQRDGNIGAELLRPFVLVLDYPNQRIAFQPHGTGAPTAAHGFLE